MAYNRLRDKVTKENLWLYILRLLIDKSMYAYEITKVIKEIFGFSTATVTVYVVLYKMRREGLIQMGAEKTVHNRRIRKYYVITAMGRESFQKGITLFKDTIRLLDLKNTISKL